MRQPLDFSANLTFLLTKSFAMLKFIILNIPPLYFLFYSLAFLPACNSPGQSNLPKDNQRSSESLPQIQSTLLDTASQIAEYVVEIYEDKKGGLWFGTMAKGAAYYDGKTITYLTEEDGLAGNTVLSFAEDKEGNLWFGTHTGASRYDGKTFTNFGQNEGLHGMGCNILMDRKGNIWAATNHGVFRFNGLFFSEFSLPDPVIENLSYKWEPGKVWNLMEDSKGNMWFARDGYGVCRYDGVLFTHFTKEDGLCSNNVCGMVEDKNGDIWFGTLSSDFPEYVNEGGLSRYDGKTFTKYPELEGLSENDIYNIGEDKSGNVWICALGLGAYRYDGEKFMLFKETDRKDLIKKFGIQAILEDSKGILWFGFSGGLFRFNGTSFINVTQNGPWR